MPISLYMDVHVPVAIAQQLRRRGVDVLTAIEDGMDELSDDALLDRAATVGRVLFTQDIRFRAMAEQRQREGRSFAGLIFGHQRSATIGQYVHDLELLAKATDMAEWWDTVVWLPL